MLCGVEEHPYSQPEELAWQQQKAAVIGDSFLSLCLLGETAEVSYAAESFSKKLCNGEWLSKEVDSILHNFLKFFKGFGKTRHLECSVHQRK